MSLSSQLDERKCNEETPIEKEQSGTSISTLTNTVSQRKKCQPGTLDVRCWWCISIVEELTTACPSHSLFFRPRIEERKRNDEQRNQGYISMTKQSTNQYTPRQIIMQCRKSKAETISNQETKGRKNQHEADKKGENGSNENDDRGWGGEMHRMLGAFGGKRPCGKASKNWRGGPQSRETRPGLDINPAARFYRANQQLLQGHRSEMHAMLRRAGIPCVNTSSAATRYVR